LHGKLPHGLVEGDNESEKAGNAMARKRDGSVDRIWYGIIVETAGNRREQGDGDGDGRRSAGWSSARWRQLSLLVFPWLLRAAATLSRRALLSRANEGRRGRRCCEAKVGGRGRDGRRWASDRLHQRDQQRQIPDGKRDVFPPPPPKERLAFVESARQRFALAGPGPTCTQHVLALAQASLSNPLCPSKATGR
jgi:hypothetical protein